MNWHIAEESQYLRAVQDSKDSIMLKRMFKGACFPY